MKMDTQKNANLWDTTRVGLREKFKTLIFFMRQLE